jgi:tripartite-type tricarboxylate transporter receptor subunit TctC
MNKLGRMLRMLLALVVLATLSAAHAQSYPSRPIKFIVAYAAGGLPDTVARHLAERLQQTMGQSVVVENRTGAGGAVAVAALLQAPADGYTFFVTDGPLLAIAPVLYEKLSYDPHDLVPVALVGTAPLFLATNSKTNIANLDEFIAAAKAKPGTLNYGSAGLGSIHHLTSEAMCQALGIDLVHVPFRGSGASVPAMIGGQVDVVFASPPALRGFVKDGRARLLAINTAKRSALAPDVPALAEKIPGFDFAFTVAVLARAGTPPEAIQRVSEEIARAVRHPETAEKLQVAGVDPIGGGPEQLAGALNAERYRIVAAARHAKLQAQ